MAKQATRSSRSARPLAERNGGANAPLALPDADEWTGSLDRVDTAGAPDKRQPRTKQQQQPQQPQQQPLPLQPQPHELPQETPRSSARRRNKSPAPSARVAEPRSRAVRPADSPTKQEDAEDGAGSFDADMGSGSGSGSSSCSSCLVRAVLIASLVIMSLSCVALILALTAAGEWESSFPQLSGAVPLFIEGPCEPEYTPEPLLGLPAPPRCRWNWRRLRCSPMWECDLGMRWHPVPHPRCMMRRD